MKKLASLIILSISFISFSNSAPYIGSESVPFQSATLSTEYDFFARIFEYENAANDAEVYKLGKRPSQQAQNTLTIQSQSSSRNYAHIGLYFSTQDPTLPVNKVMYEVFINFGIPSQYGYVNNGGQISIDVYDYTDVGFLIRLFTDEEEDQTLDFAFDTLLHEWVTKGVTNNEYSYSFFNLGSWTDLAKSTYPIAANYLRYFLTQSPVEDEPASTYFIYSIISKDGTTRL